MSRRVVEEYALLFGLVFALLLLGTVAFGPRVMQAFHEAMKAQPN